MNGSLERLGLSGPRQESLEFVGLDPAEQILDPVAASVGLRLGLQELARDTEPLATMQQTLFVMQEHRRLALIGAMQERGIFP